MLWRNVGIIYILRAFIHEDLVGKIHMKMEGRLEELMAKLDS